MAKLTKRQKELNRQIRARQAVLDKLSEKSGSLPSLHLRGDETRPELLKIINREIKLAQGFIANQESLRKRRKEDEKRGVDIETKYKPEEPEPLAENLFIDRDGILRNQAGESFKDTSESGDPIKEDYRYNYDPERVRYPGYDTLADAINYRIDIPVDSKIIYEPPAIGGREGRFYVIVIYEQTEEGRQSKRQKEALRRRNRPKADRHKNKNRIKSNQGKRKKKK